MVSTPDELPRIGDLEMAVLEHLWEVGESDVQATHASIGAERGISPNTVGSAMERLQRKGLLTREKVSHAYRYRALLDRRAFRARRVLEAAGGLRELGKRDLLAAFVDLVADSDRDALDELERIIRAKREGADS